MDTPFQLASAQAGRGASGVSVDGGSAGAAAAPSSGAGLRPTASARSLRASSSGGGDSGGAAAFRGVALAATRLKSGVGKVGSGVGKVAGTGIGAALKGVKGVSGGVLSTGRGFREFLLKGPIVELSVAVVVGIAFTDLVNAMVKSFITPLIAAIFRGVSFDSMYFTINKSRFMYGQAINAIIVFFLVLAVIYFCIMQPFQKFTAIFYPNRAEQKDCPRCLSEIPLAATRCKYCCSDVEITEEQQEVLEKLANDRIFGRAGCGVCFSVGEAAVKGAMTVGRSAGDLLTGADRSKSKRGDDDGDVTGGAGAVGGGDVSGGAKGAGGGGAGIEGPEGGLEVVVDGGGAPAAASAAAARGKASGPAAAASVARLQGNDNGADGWSTSTGSEPARQGPAPQAHPAEEPFFGPAGPPPPGGPAGAQATKAWAAPGGGPPATPDQNAALRPRQPAPLAGAAAAGEQAGGGAARGPGVYLPSLPPPPAAAGAEAAATQPGGAQASGGQQGHSVVSYLVRHFQTFAFGGA